MTLGCITWSVGGTDGLGLAAHQVRAQLILSALEVSICVLGDTWQLFLVLSLVVRFIWNRREGHIGPLPNGSGCAYLAQLKLRQNMAIDPPFPTPW